MSYMNCLALIDDGTLVVEWGGSYFFFFDFEFSNEANGAFNWDQQRKF